MWEGVRLCLWTGHLHRRRFRLNLPRGKVNKEGPDFFGWDGHSESFISTTVAPFVAWDKDNTEDKACQGIRRPEVHKMLKFKSSWTDLNVRASKQRWSHLFLNDLSSSTSTSADWWCPRFLWENAPPALLLPLCPATHPVHTGNDKERKTCKVYF